MTAEQELYDLIRDLLPSTAPMFAPNVAPRAIVDRAAEIAQAYLDARREALGAEIAKLDPHQKWMQEHQDEVNTWKGRFIAIHPERGIVALDTTYGRLCDTLDMMQIPDSEVVIEWVRP